MFSGTINNNGCPEVNNVVDTNWHLCDGTEGTPDLRDKFVKCVSSNTSTGQTGGAKQKTLTTNHLPAHTHNIEKNKFSHGHNIENNKLRQALSHHHQYEKTQITSPSSSKSNYFKAVGETTNDTTGAQWESSQDVQTDSVWAENTQDIASSSAGSGQSFEIQPQHYILAFIMRIA